MTTDQLKNCVKKLKGLFPAASVEQCELLKKRFDAYGERVVLAAIQDHASLHTDLSIPGLIEGLRSKSMAMKAASSEHRRLCDEIRYLARTRWGIHDYQHLSDSDLIVTHHSRCWQTVRDDQSLPEPGIQAVRKIIQEACRRGLAELGYPEDEAVQIARDVVELELGERIRLMQLWEA